MALTIGIVGLPNVGKSTLFNALTRASVLAANYPFATIEPNIGVVPLPDPRLDRLAEIFSSARILPATVSFVDIAGIVRGASQGEGLGNKFLAHIREADAICQVVRVFRDDDVAHVEGAFSPALRRRDDRDRAVPGRPADAREGGAAAGEAGPDEQGAPARLGQRARRPALPRGGADPVCRPRGIRGRPHPGARAAAAHDQAVHLHVQPRRGPAAPTPRCRPRCASWWRRPTACSWTPSSRPTSPSSTRPRRAELLESVGVTQPGLEQLAQVGFHTLGLQTFLTAGPKEARAWTIRQGWTRAAGRRGHPHRLPARVHQGRDRLLRRPGRRGLDGGRPGGWAGPDRGQGLRHARRGRRRVPDHQGVGGTCLPRRTPCPR